jgi:hypothetical protein
LSWYGEYISYTSTALPSRPFNHVPAVIPQFISYHTHTMSPDSFIELHTDQDAARAAATALNYQCLVSRVRLLRHDVLSQWSDSFRIVSDRQVATQQLLACSF